MYKKVKFGVCLFSFFFAAAFCSPSSANEWLDGLKSLKNEAIKNVPSVSNVMGKKLLCKRVDGFFAESHTLVLNTTLRTLLWESYEGETLNLPMHIIENSAQFIEAEVTNIDFFEAASEVDPKIRDIFSSIEGQLREGYGDRRQSQIAMRLFYQTKIRIILNRTNGETKFIEDAMEWPSKWNGHHVEKPSKFVGKAKQTRRFLCEKLEQKF